MSFTTHLTYPRKKNSLEVGFVVDITQLIIKINEYDIGAGYLADPLYRLSSECVTVLIINLEQMIMSLQKWSYVVCCIVWTTSI